MSTTPTPKPLGRKAYGSIPHLPASRLGPGDHMVHDGQYQLCCVRPRDRHDLITVEEKLDGSCCAVALLASGEIVALGRAGHRAWSSRFEQHHFFARWVQAHEARFRAVLRPGERVVGEWLAQAHGTRYALPHEPFVVFDLFTADNQRLAHAALDARLAGACVRPRVIHQGGSLSIAAVVDRLEPSGHGALDPVEGAVWRVERRGAVDFLAKYVRRAKVDGCYLPAVSGQPAIWHWRPEGADGGH